MRSAVAPSTERINSMSLPISIFPPIVSQLTSPPADVEQAGSQSTTAGLGTGANVVNAPPAPSEAPTSRLPDSKESPIAASELIQNDANIVHVDANFVAGGGSHPVDVEQALAANHKPGFVASQALNLGFTHLSGENAASITGSVKGREASIPGASQVGYTGIAGVTHDVGFAKLGVAATMHGINALDVVKGDPIGEPAGYRYVQAAATGDSKVPLFDGAGLTLHAEAGYRASPGLNNRINTAGAATLTDQVGPARIDFSASVIAARWTDRVPAGEPQRIDVLPTAEIKASIPLSDHVQAVIRAGVDGRKSNEDTHAAPKNYANFGAGVGVQVSLDGAVKIKP
jgi:hypothetical protein